MRKPIIIGNWKMNNGPEKAHLFYHDLEKLMLNKEVDIDWAIAAPIISMPSLMMQTEDGLYIPLAAQNVNENDSGAFTGEVSISMLQEYGTEYVIIGHSERREMFNETNSSVNAKVKAIIKSFTSEDDYIIPVVAFGETEEQFNANKTALVVKKQLNECLKGLDADDVKEIVIAYEPIWAIGTGKTATPEQAQKICKLSRDIIAEMFGKETADEIRIQYGGSMKPENINELMKQPDIDGGLVGGASLEPESFFKLITFNK
ncbi:MAG: triose-phosphate isomerase [Mycoplasmataceae bacterium]|nr:triose-phosphate isomerase [Mycoplasmataceae bacterium]